jgi:putative transcriptional regulator
MIGMAIETIKPSSGGAGYLDGQFLLAMPGMADTRFSRSVVYICAHSPDGAMGLIINQPARKITFSDLLLQLNLVPADELIRLPTPAEKLPVLKGGPVETGRGFVLHTADFFIDNSTLPIDDCVSLTATVDILRAIAKGDGPRKAMLALGYAGWSPGQLEEEIQQNGWLNVPADPGLLFDGDLEGKYGRALKLLGIDPARLSGEAGHA